MAALGARLADNADGSVLTAPQMSATSSSGSRSVSHGRRTQSLSAGHHSATTSSAATASQGLQSAGTGTAATASAGGEGGGGGGSAAEGTTASGAAGLTRRNNTVSTASSSRLVRLERNRARLALCVSLPVQSQTRMRADLGDAAILPGKESVSAKRTKNFTSRHPQYTEDLMLSGAM